MIKICGLLGLSIFLPTAIPSTWAAEPSFHVLFLGNSTFSANGGSLRPFEEFCKAAGIKAKAVSQDGRIDPFIRNQANDQNILKLIRNGKFSHVVLLTRSSDFLNDIEKKAAFAGFRKLHETIVQSGSRTVISMAYPIQGEYSSFAKVRRGHEELKDVLEAHAVNGVKQPVTLVPVGALWMRGQERFGETIWYTDPRHGGRLAQYGNGCLWFSYLTGTDPRQNSYAGGLPNEQIDWIKNKVWELRTRSEPGK